MTWDVAPAVTLSTASCYALFRLSPRPLFLSVSLVREAVRHPLVCSRCFRVIFLTGKKKSISVTSRFQTVGISVEFCSHIARAFAVSVRAGRVERAREALSDMGSSVSVGLNGEETRCLAQCVRWVGSSGPHVSWCRGWSSRTRIEVQMPRMEFVQSLLGSMHKQIETLEGCRVFISSNEKFNSNLSCAKHGRCTVLIE